MQSKTCNPEGKRIGERERKAKGEERRREERGERHGMSHLVDFYFYYHFLGSKSFQQQPSLPCKLAMVTVLFWSMEIKFVLLMEG
jgi:hypothetical protein